MVISASRRRGYFGVDHYVMGRDWNLGINVRDERLLDVVGRLY